MQNNGWQIIVFQLVDQIIMIVNFVQVGFCYVFARRGDTIKVTGPKRSISSALQLFNRWQVNIYIELQKFEGST